MNDLELKAYYFRMATDAFKAMSKTDQEEVISASESHHEEPHWKLTLRAIQLIAEELKKASVLAETKPASQTPKK